MDFRSSSIENVFEVANAYKGERFFVTAFIGNDAVGRSDSKVLLSPMRIVY